MCSECEISHSVFYRPKCHLSVVVTDADYIGRRAWVRCDVRVSLFVCLFVQSITQKRMIAKWSNLVQGMSLVYPRSGTVFGCKRSRSQGQQVHFAYENLARTAIHRHSLGGDTSRLRFRGCLVRASLTFARWRNHCDRRRGLELSIECLLVVVVAAAARVCVVRRR